MLAVLVLLFVAALALLRYVMRVPRDYPFRGVLMTVAVLAVVGFGGAAAWQGVVHARRGTTKVLAVRDRYLATRPADSLAAYVTPYPGATMEAGSGMRAQPAGSTKPAGGRWTLVTADPAARVMAHYRAAAGEGGWTVEMSGRDFLMLRRTATALGASGTERLRVQARRGQRAGRTVTFVEHELTRRF